MKFKIESLIKMSLIPYIAVAALHFALCPGIVLAATGESANAKDNEIVFPQSVGGISKIEIADATGRFFRGPLRDDEVWGNGRAAASKVVNFQ